MSEFEQQLLKRIEALEAEVRSLRYQPPQHANVYHYHQWANHYGILPNCPQYPLYGGGGYQGNSLGSQLSSGMSEGGIG